VHHSCYVVVVVTHEIPGFSLKKAAEGVCMLRSPEMLPEFCRGHPILP